MLCTFTTKANDRNDNTDALLINFFSAGFDNPHSTPYIKPNEYKPLEESGGLLTQHAIIVLRC